jgi:hypothetical protein
MKIPGITDDQLREIAEYLVGTCESIDTGLEMVYLNPDDFDVTDVEDAILDYNVEMCPGCGWWFEGGELNDGEGCDDEFGWNSA